MLPSETPLWFSAYKWVQRTACCLFLAAAVAHSLWITCRGSSVPQVWSCCTPCLTISPPRLTHTHSFALIPKCQCEKLQCVANMPLPLLQVYSCLFLHQQYSNHLEAQLNENLHKLSRWKMYSASSSLQLWLANANTTDLLWISNCKLISGCLMSLSVALASFVAFGAYCQKSHFFKLKLECLTVNEPEFAL